MKQRAAAQAVALKTTLTVFGMARLAEATPLVPATEISHPARQLHITQDVLVTI